MKKLAIPLLAFGLTLAQIAQGAQGDCQPLPSAEGDTLVELISRADADAVLQINLDDGQVCTLENESLNADSAASFQLSAALDELAIEATVEGFQTWLRVDTEYSGELLLDRATAEGLDLTAAEFLGDNSQLEASDFFVEFVGSLKLGETELRSVETDIPLLEVPYDHYANRGPKPALSAPEAEFLTVGSLGEAILEDVIITVDIAKQLIAVTDAE